MRRASDCPFGRAGALVTLVLTSELGGVWLGISALLRCSCATPRADALPLLLGTKARNHVRSTPGERLPVRSGWCFGWVGADGRAGSLVAGIKCAAWELVAPTHGQMLSLCCWAPKPGIKCVARRASACPFGRAGALVKLVLRGERGLVWLGLIASLGCCVRQPTGRRTPSVAGHPCPESSPQRAGRAPDRPSGLALWWRWFKRVGGELWGMHQAPRSPVACAILRAGARPLLQGFESRSWRRQRPTGPRNGGRICRVHSPHGFDWTFQQYPCYGSRTQQTVRGAHEYGF